MKANIIIRKASGESQPFNLKKLEESLVRAGATPSETVVVSEGILKWIETGVTTRKLYQKAFELLRSQRRSLAARYSLKRALMGLGPTGYPFEHFVGQLFASQGYSIEVGVILDGACVQHEMDVVATKGNRQCLVECKFHNGSGKVSSVQTPLYVRSRVDDIVKKRKEDLVQTPMQYEGWIVTNTRFTSEAQEYGRCANLHLMSWDYPIGHSLKEMIERERLFPVTVLTSLSKAQIALLLERGVVLCRQLIQSPEHITQMDLTIAKRKRLEQELDGVCG